MQHHTDARLYLVNSLALLISLTQMETILRFTLLILSIIFTIHQLHEKWEARKERKKQKNETTSKEIT